MSDSIPLEDQSHSPTQSLPQQYPIKKVGTTKSAEHRVGFPRIARCDANAIAPLDNLLTRSKAMLPDPTNPPSI
jgi:hypothetical protein